MMHKPLILGLDLATLSGWAIWDMSRHRSSIECGIFEFPDKSPVEYKAAQLGLKLTRLIRHAKDRYERNFDMAVAEEALKRPLKGATSTVVSCMLHGSAYATLANHGVMFGTIPSQTWRAEFYGRGFKPPLRKSTSRGGKVTFQDDWKQAAIDACQTMGIQLPSTKEKAHNAAESCAIAIEWQRAKLFNDRHYERFMALRQRRNERSVAA